MDLDRATAATCLYSWHVVSPKVPTFYFKPERGYADGVNSRVLPISLIALVWAWSLPAQGQRVSIDAALHAVDKPYVQATGEATVSAKPDQAVVEIGVVTQGPTAMAVAAQNARQTDAVLADLHKLLGGSNRLKTTSYSVRPNYQYPKPGAAAAITGYVANNIVEVTLDDLTQVSKVIDGATQSGANSIQKVQYRLKNSRLVRGQALREAAEEAKASAEAIAAGLGLRVVRVLSAEEAMSEESFGIAKKAPPPPPPGPAPATPVEVGLIEVSATVTLRAEIGQ
jgi:uncharacterized protein YggE